MFVPMKALADSQTKVLFFYHEGCPWCVKMDGILRDPEMLSLLSGHAQLVKIDVEGRQMIPSLQQSGVGAAREFKVYGTPTVIFMAAGKKEILRIPGALSKEDFWDVVCQYIPGIKREKGCAKVVGAL